MTAERWQERLDGSVATDVPLGPLTTFRVGGAARLMVEAETVDDLVVVAQECRDRDKLVVGRGSNMLVCDQGFDGVAVRLGQSFRNHAIDGPNLDIGGAVSLPAMARLTPGMELTGFEFAAEIPGSFGGAVRMNAGAHGTTMADILEHADVVSLSDGTVTRWSVDDLEYGYRTSALGPDDVVVGGRIRLAAGHSDAVAATIADHLRWRREHQPPGRSAGSVFRNPPEDSAGRLVEAAGLKGTRHGDAEISSVHANFIVVGADASAADVWHLIDLAWSTVREKFGVTLIPEVRLVGRFQGDLQVHLEGA